MEDYPRQKEILNASFVEETVRDNLHFLRDTSKRWWASDYFGFMEVEGSGSTIEERKEAYRGPLHELRGEAELLEDQLLVVLIGNMVTEEALPNYSARLNNIFPDRTGVGAHPFQQWNRSWTAEEDQHGRVLDRYLLLTGRVNMQEVDRSIDSLLRSGMESSPDLLQGLFYPAFQELATQISHQNVSRRASEQGVHQLAVICDQIQRDEGRHYGFYANLGSSLFEHEPTVAIKSFAALMQDGVVMPAKRMEDSRGTLPGSRQLFDYFAMTAMNLEVYTPSDYLKVYQKLLSRWKIDRLSVSDAEARAAQEYLARTLPDDLRQRAERFERLRGRLRPVPFPWIYNRKA